VSSLAAPTRAEINAGVDLTSEITAISGFQLTNSPIPVPNLGTVFTPQIEGEDTVADSMLTFNDDDASDTARAALAKGTAGFLLFMPYGDVTAARAEVWPVRSTGFNDEWSLDNVAAKAMAGFAVTDVPEQDAAVPAP
jgi:hypothetical protein